MAIVNTAVANIHTPQLTGTTVTVTVDATTDDGNSISTNCTFTASSTSTQMKSAILSQLKAAYLSAFPQDTISSSVVLVIFGAPL